MIPTKLFNCSRKGLYRRLPQTATLGLSLCFITMDMTYIIVFLTTIVFLIAVGLICWFVYFLVCLDIKLERTIWKIPFRIVCFCLLFAFVYVTIFFKVKDDTISVDKVAPTKTETTE